MANRGTRKLGSLLGCLDFPQADCAVRASSGREREVVGEAAAVDYLRVVHCFAFRWGPQANYGHFAVGSTRQHHSVLACERHAVYIRVHAQLVFLTARVAVPKLQTLIAPACANHVRVGAEGHIEPLRFLMR